MTPKQHIHKLKRHNFKSGNSVYFCVDDCNFKVAVALALGKRTECWRCGIPFTMNEYSIRLAKPHCEGCHKPKDGEKIHPEFPENRIAKQGEVPMTLAERLSATIESAKPVEEDI